MKTLLIVGITLGVLIALNPKKQDKKKTHRVVCINGVNPGRVAKIAKWKDEITGKRWYAILIVKGTDTVTRFVCTDKTSRGLKVGDEIINCTEKKKK